MKRHCSTAGRRIRFHLQPGKRGVRRGAGAGLGNHSLAGLFQVIGQILPGDGMIDDMGSARILRGKAALQPVDSVGLLDMQSVFHRYAQGGGRSFEPVRLVGPDIGHQPQTIFRG